MYPSSDNGRCIPLMEMLVVTEFSVVTYRALDALAKVRKFFIRSTGATRKSTRCSRTREILLFETSLSK
jgi:hypothetical protein